MYDLIIVGAGPAGITAAVYAARKKLKLLVLTRNIGGQASWSGDIQNYTGFQFIPGPELAKKFEEHLKSFDNIDLKENSEVICIEKNNEHFLVKTIKEEFETKTVILATGRMPKLLGIPGEKEFKNKGVTYCATCDGPIFTGKDVAIIGAGNSSLDATLQMIPIANRIYLINKNKEFNTDKIMLEKAIASSNVEIITGAVSKEIFGEKFVKGIKIIVNGQERSLNVSGIFIEIGSIPVNDPTKCAGTEWNDKNEVIINERCETTVPGFYAAGDVTNISEKQIIVAAGQGCIASLQAFKYLSRKK